jgi:hypothetical protein
MGGVKIVKVCWIPFRGGVWVLNTTFWQIGDLQTGTQTQLLIYILRVSHSAKPLGWCSTVETTKQRLGDLRHHLKRRRYNGKVIESGFSKVSEINRNNLLEYKEKKINKRIPLVLTLSNIIPSLFRENFRHRPFHHWKEIEKSETLAKLFPEQSVVAFGDLKALRIQWSEMRYLDLHRRSASVNHVVTSVASAVSNYSTHKCSIVSQQERSKRSFAMSIAKHLTWFTSLTVTSVGRNT